MRFFILIIIALAWGSCSFKKNDTSGINDQKVVPDSNFSFLGVKFGQPEAVFVKLLKEEKGYYDDPKYSDENFVVLRGSFYGKEVTLMTFLDIDHKENIHGVSITMMNPTQDFKDELVEDLCVKYGDYVEREPQNAEIYYQWDFKEGSISLLYYPNNAIELIYENQLFPEFYESYYNKKKDL